MCARQFLPERRFWKYGLVNQLFQIIRVDVAQLILLCGHSIFRVTSAVESDMLSLRHITVLMLRVTCSPTGPLALVVRRRISSCTTTVTLPAVCLWTVWHSIGTRGAFAARLRAARRVQVWRAGAR